jgi:hypothetical protein
VSDIETPPARYTMTLDLTNEETDYLYSLVDDEIQNTEECIAEDGEDDHMLKCLAVLRSLREKIRNA